MVDAGLDFGRRWAVRSGRHWAGLRSALGSEEWSALGSEEWSALGWASVNVGLRSNGLSREAGLEDWKSNRLEDWKRKKEEKPERERKRKRKKYFFNRRGERNLIK